MVIGEQYMTILEEKVPIAQDEMNIDDLQFLPENPRIYACTHGDPHFKDYPAEKQQLIIYEHLLKEESVKKLVPEIRRQGGLVEPILVRLDTKQVIEGNSRLAAYRKLAKLAEKETDKKGPDKWRVIPCQIISKLTELQQAAYLDEIHVKGKTDWKAYEKANFTYVRYANGMPVKEIAKLFGESVQEIKKRVAIIQMMKDAGESERSHFSYYDVLVRNPTISQEIGNNPEAKSFIVDRIKSFAPVDQNVPEAQDVPAVQDAPEAQDVPPVRDAATGRGAEKQGTKSKGNGFTSGEMRKKFPEIIKKPKVLKKLLAEEITFDDAYENAKVSDAHQRVKKARNFLDGIEKNDLAQLDQNRKNALVQEFKKLKRVIERVGKVLDDLNKH